MKKFGLTIWLLINYLILGAQVYTVNSANDADDGSCDGVHCSFREAIKAAEADGMASTIRFNIPGAGPHIISPTGAFPTINNPSLLIDAESQAGGPGSIVLKFAFRNFMGLPFWSIQASDVTMIGLSFSDFLFDTAGDCILQFSNADDCLVRNCSFFADNNINAVAEKVSIRISSADRFRLYSSHFGTDLLKSSIVQTDAYVKVEASQGTRTAQIDSCIFTAKNKMIEINGGLISMSKNIFGALDTSKSVNFLSPLKGVHVLAAGSLNAENNFFFGIDGECFDITSVDQTTLISKNRFYNNQVDVLVSSCLNNPVEIVDNYCRNGFQFVQANFLKALIVERNNVNNYDGFIIANTPASYEQARYMDNRFTCITNTPVIMPSHPVPVITSVNRDLIMGTGVPNDSLVVYTNSLLLCPADNCKGGVELGRTRVDATGNWMLNAAYPNRTYISAYQFDSNPVALPRLHSELSSCYSCSTPVILRIDTSVCLSQNVTIRGKVYSASNPKDSIFVRGDGISICDSTILINVNVQSETRNQLDLSICYNDSLVFGSVVISKNHLIDSLLLKTSAGCDSIVILSGKEVGVSNFSQTICDNASVTIGGMVFDKNKTSGTAVIPGAATAGCDSVIFVQLNINNFSESFIKRNMCPGEFLLINGTLFDENNLKGDVTLTRGSSTGCDSIIHVDLTYPDNRGIFTTTICRGDSVFVIDRFFSENNSTATILLTGGSSFGCDSIIDVTINLLPKASGTFTSDICRGDTLFIAGEPFFSGRTTGTILLANSAANGCDSIVNVSLSVLPDAIGNLDTTLCDNQSLTYYGQTFSVTRPRGSFKIPNGSFQMCDSFVMVNVNFIPEMQGNFNPMICKGDSVRVGNQIFSATNVSGSVRLVGASSAGCDSVVNVLLQIAPPIQLAFNTTDLVCNRQNSGSLTINSITGGSGSFNVSIDGQSPVVFTNGLNFSSLSSGNHNILITDQLGCDTSLNFNINTSQVLQLSLPNDTTIKKGGVVSIQPGINFIFSTAQWSPSTFLSCDTCLNTQSAPDQTISYTLTVTDQNGCSISDQITITVIVDEAEIYVPNAFSPNGDNINDRFKPVFKFPERSKILVFRIYDRWGSLIFEHLNAGVGDIVEWDGTYQKEKLNPGVYTYTIQYAGEDNIGKWKIGDITLIR